ncbi:MAG: phosphate ABC transporter substrate-binding protein PstS [Planctomycetia bacterium]|nr:phosphate ABC transporter substrate-binding protein PstS [Planctomycetia bacterium]
MSRTGIGLVLGLVVLAGCFSNDWEVSEKGDAVVLNGAGATFPSPVYSVWAFHFTESTERQVQVNYQGVGSGAGVNQLKEGTIDFAGSDSPLQADELEKDGLTQFPMLAGGVVVVLNVPGMTDGACRLPADVLADIFLGKITKWNDPRIVAANPDGKLPDLDITVVYRADSSGTSFLFTHYLTQVSPPWAEKVGAGAAVRFPVGIGGQKNPGVCNNVAKISGAISYTEYSYALETGLACASLQNAAGKFVAPSVASFTEALKNADWEKAPGFYMILTNAAGENSYPITGITYLLYRKNLDETKKSALWRYLDWCFTGGKFKARELHYVPIPEEVVEKIQEIHP